MVNVIIYHYCFCMQEAKTIIAALNTEINKKQIETQKAIDEFEQTKKRLIEIEKEKADL